MKEAPLVSAIIPTRKRLMRLIKTVDSLFDTAKDPKRIEVVLRIDEDDHETLLGFPTQKYPEGAIKRCVGSRYTGYHSMGKFVTEACAMAEGFWCFLIDDDAWLVGEHWDEKLAAVPTQPDCVCQPERYWLGESYYAVGSCGPVGLIFPNLCWVELGFSEILDPADEFLRTLLVRQNGWPVHLLAGITYRHDRDTEEVLKAHHLL